jgi:AraC-like DNA-binding protein
MRGPVGPLAAALASLLADRAEPIGRLRAVEAAVAVAEGLAHLAEHGPRWRTAPRRSGTVCCAGSTSPGRRSAPGRSLTQAAADSGFADQSHRTRHFKRAYGITPGRWRHLIGPAAP